MSLMFTGLFQSDKILDGEFTRPINKLNNPKKMSEDVLPSAARTVCVAV